MDNKFILNFREFLEYVDPPVTVGTIFSLSPNPQRGSNTSYVPGIIVQGGSIGQKNLLLPSGEYKTVNTNPINIQVSPVDDTSIIYVITKTELGRRDKKAYDAIFPPSKTPAAPQKPSLGQRMAGTGTGPGISTSKYVF